MAVSTQHLTLTSGLRLTRDTDADGTSEAAVSGGAAVLYLVQIDNTGNSAQKVYLKLYNAAAPTIGTTAPDMIVPAPAGATVRMAIPLGVAFGTNLSFACVTAGGTAGTTNPTNDVAVSIVYSV